MSIAPIISVARTEILKANDFLKKICQRDAVHGFIIINFLQASGVVFSYQCKSAPKPKRQGC